MIYRDLSDGDIPRMKARVLELLRARSASTEWVAIQLGVRNDTAGGLLASLTAPPGDVVMLDGGQWTSRAFSEEMADFRARCDRARTAVAEKNDEDNKENDKENKTEKEKENDKEKEKDMTMTKSQAMKACRANRRTWKLTREQKDRRRDAVLAVIGEHPGIVGAEIAAELRRGGETWASYNTVMSVLADEDGTDGTRLTKKVGAKGRYMWSLKEPRDVMAEVAARPEGKAFEGRQRTERCLYPVGYEDIVKTEDTVEDTPVDVTEDTDEGWERLKEALGRAEERMDGRLKVTVEKVTDGTGAERPEARRWAMVTGESVETFSGTEDEAMRAARLLAGAMRHDVEVFSISSVGVARPMDADKYQ